MNKTRLKKWSETFLASTCRFKNSKPFQYDLTVWVFSKSSMYSPLCALFVCLFAVLSTASFKRKRRHRTQRRREEKRSEGSLSLNPTSSKRHSQQPAAAGNREKTERRQRQRQRQRDTRGKEQHGH